jgi:hypothetical protein
VHNLADTRRSGVRRGFGVCGVIGLTCMNILLANIIVARTLMMTTCITVRNDELPKESWKEAREAGRCASAPATRERIIIIINKPGT